eukprot:gnl/TRDRNA2_/TRDRNA2_178076_c0_seq5.p2 gnl/TRDRNA2_/TRDRNA2_178076_c0~~gnl/TRDRNA2_/TRDRNA2_178076_c0_seq5.p2  ORF type:complete len:119 (+),score=2.26 gnl/TRDRNA2_/TRDRNA2_178076_c0_seq5:425-781(+)
MRVDRILWEEMFVMCGQSFDSACFVSSSSAHLAQKPCGRRLGLEGRHIQWSARVRRLRNCLFTLGRRRFLTTLKDEMIARRFFSSKPCAAYHHRLQFAYPSWTERSWAMCYATGSTVA